MLVSVAGVTVSVVAALTPLIVAVIVVEPVPMHVANPLEPEALLIVPTVAFEETHDTEVVRFCVVPSE